MYAVVRTYSGKGAEELFDMLEERKTEVRTPNPVPHRLPRRGLGAARSRAD